MFSRQTIFSTGVQSKLRLNLLSHYLRKLDGAGGLGIPLGRLAKPTPLQETLSNKHPTEPDTGRPEITDLREK